ncbi:hypothetical protein DQ04_15031020, partial [Trypanosoma grayi]|uniref:hypothetical protein n=1 Tax=Trypanosoma grayi TaxID=71804 RepID=UPI0004F4BB39
MSDSFALLLASVELIVFFTFDFVFARVLNTLKHDHPELEECAPEDSPDLDPVAVIDSLRHTAVELYDHQQQRLAGGVGEDVGDGSDGLNTAASPPLHRANVLHNVVV